MPPALATAIVAPVAGLNGNCCGLCLPVHLGHDADHTRGVWFEDSACCAATGEGVLGHQRGTLNPGWGNTERYRNPFDAVTLSILHLNGQLCLARTGIIKPLWTSSPA